MRLPLAVAALMGLAVAAGADEEIAVGLPAPGFTLRALNPDECGATAVHLDRLVGPESVFLIARDGTIARIERGYGEDAASLLLGDVQRALGPAARTARAARASE